VKPRQAIGTTRAIDGTAIVETPIFSTNRRDDGLSSQKTTIG